MSATYSLQPIEYTNVNLFVPVSSWLVSHNSPATLFFVLMMADGFGTRRFVPPAGTSVKLSFVKSRAPVVGSNATLISRTAVALAPVEDKSLFKVDLTAADTATLITGGITLSVTVSGVEYTSNIPNIIVKNMNQPGF
jgi:hypothetical protein